jgi:hypothetical protein
MDRTFNRKWAGFKVSVAASRSAKQAAQYAKAMQQLRDKELQSAPVAELDRTAYLSEQFLNNRKTK